MDQQGILPLPLAVHLGLGLQRGAPGRLLRRGRGSPTFAKDGFREVASPAWLGRNRRLAKDYEENPRVSEAWVYLGMLRLLVKRLARAA